MATSPGKSWKVLESPGIGFSPGKASWKIGKFNKSPGKVLDFYLEKSWNLGRHFYFQVLVLVLFLVCFSIDEEELCPSLLHQV